MFKVQTEGDAFFVAFADAISAVRACAQAQRSLIEEPWPVDAVVRVRMGVHSGLASPHGDDYIAFAVHQAARVVDAGHGGQIVVSCDTARHFFAIDDLALAPLGRFRVRDFDDPVELFQVTGVGLPDRFAPLRILPADRHNLVRASTSLVGRSDDLAALHELFGTARLVSAVGPGGLGKTRLATEYGLRHADDWEDGIWFVDLSAITDAAHVPGAIVDAMGVSVAGKDDVWAAVLAHFHDRRALLILDNCEQLAGGVGRLADALLRTCPGVAVLVTSREPLGLRAERIWRPPSLSCDGPAIELFADRAGLGPDLDADERASVEELCRLLDGLPLAIELAAARCDVLSPEEIVGHLGRSRGLLRSGDPTLTGRQRSLDATLDWSHALLSVPEQVVFRRLGIFAGGFGLEAAAAAVSDEAVEAYDVPELVWSLVSKSLVISEPAAGSTRYGMLETIRTYAAQRLSESGDLPDTASRVGSFYRDAYGPQHTKGNLHIINERHREIENLRALVPLVAPHDEELAQSVAWAVLSDFRIHTPGVAVDEGLRFVEMLPSSTPTRTGLLTTVAAAALESGRLGVATELLDQAQLASAGSGLPVWLEGVIDQQRGVLDLRQREPGRARERAVRALAQCASPNGRRVLNNLLAMASAELGDYEAARDAAERALEIARELDRVEESSIDLGNLAELEMRAGNYQAAAQHQNEGLTLAVQLGAVREFACAMVVAARLASLDDDWAGAAKLQTVADVMMARIGFTLIPSDRAICDRVLADAATRLGSSGFAEEVRAGTELPITDAIDLTRGILSTIAAVSRGSQQRGHLERPAGTDT